MRIRSVDGPRATDGSFPLHMRTLTNVPEGYWPASTWHMVVGNGAWGSHQTFGRTVRAFIQAASADDQPVGATFYRDPYFGEQGCAQDDRRQRLHLAHTALAEQVERPVHMLAHSWSVGPALDEALDQDSTGLPFASFLAYTPAHRYRGAPQLTRQDIFDRARQEARAGGAYAGPGSIGSTIMGCLNFASMLATAHDAVWREVDARCNDDHSQSLAELSWSTRTGVMLADQDAMYGPAHVVRQDLLGAGYTGRFAELRGATHAAAVGNYTHGAQIYPCMRDLQDHQPTLPPYPF